MIKIEIDDHVVTARISSMPDKMRASLRRTVRDLTQELESKVKAKLTDDVLHVRSGALRRSIFSTVNETATSITGKVASSGDVKYAAIHEFGGTINHPGGTAYIVTSGMALGALFLSNATAANFKASLPRTKPHQIPIPERSFMRSSLDEMKDKIVEGITEAVHEGTRG